MNTSEEKSTVDALVEPNLEPNQPRPGESELDYFERVLRRAEEKKAKRFLEWNREQTLRGG